MSSAANRSIQGSHPSPSVQHVDFLEEELNRRYADQAAELVTLREMNATLLERLKEFQQRDHGRLALEDRARQQEAELQRLRESEISLRGALALQEEENSDLRKRIGSSGAELASLNQALADQDAAFKHFKADMSRKLAKLTDETWAKDLEIESLRAMSEAEGNETARLKEDFARLQRQLQESEERSVAADRRATELEGRLHEVGEESARALREAREAHLHEIESLQETNQAVAVQLSRVNSERSAIEEEMERRNADHEARVREFEERLERERNESESRIRLLEEKRRLEAEEIVRLHDELSAREKALEDARSEHERRQKEASDLIAALEESLEASKGEFERAREHAARALSEIKQQHAQQAEVWRVREHQLGAEIARVRSENQNLQGLLTAANETVMELHGALEAIKNERIAEVQRLEHESRQALAALHMRLQNEFRQNFESVGLENTRLRQLLETRDTQNETERKNLKQWQEQLSFLDQHLKQTKDGLKRDRAEVLRLAKLLAAELQMARSHPFKDCLDVAEAELSKLQTQLGTVSSVSPMRMKMEERLAQMIEQRDFLQKVVDVTEGQLEERIQSVATIMKNATAAGA